MPANPQIEKPATFTYRHKRYSVMSRVTMPNKWQCYSVSDSGDFETWNLPDGTIVWINPLFHEAIWMNPSEEVLADWPNLDSPMEYPSNASMIKCAIPDCGMCAFLADIHTLADAVVMVLCAS